MGCFSYLCKECGKGILSSSFSGEQVNLYLLENARVVETMSGEYDSYGRVFIDNTQREDCRHSIRKSRDWTHGEWGDLVMSHFNEENKGSGFAAIHKKCFKGEIPITRSDDDPNQGWGEDLEGLGSMDYDLGTTKQGE